MRKSWPYLVIGMAIVLLCSRALRAKGETLAESAPNRVIDPAAQNPAEPVPVVSSVVLDPSRTLMATAGDDHLVRIWNNADGQLVHRLAGHRDWVRVAVFRPDGKVLATAGDDRRVLFWDVASGKLAAEEHEQPASIY